MAVDEVLLEGTQRTGRCCWRFYQWGEPTLSLGYFQQHDDRSEHPASRTCPAVRRLTGGGAILHDRELTYSFVAPLEHRLALRRDDLYRVIHETLIDALASLGVQAGLFGREPAGAERQPFLCFQRRTAGDVVAGEVKIAGSAQRRGSGAILQHGSILLHRSAAAPELAGIAEACGQRLTPEQLALHWQPRLGERLQVSWGDSQLTPEEQATAEERVATRYASARWTIERRLHPSGT